MIFAAQNNQIVPQNQSKGTWLWDIAYTTTDVIEKNGGMRQTFYCPSGSINWNNDQYWRFSEAISGSAVVNGKISEPEPSSEQIRAYLWRVTSYTNMIELAPPIGPRSASPAGTGNKKWIKNLGAIKQSSAMEIICDTTLYSTISKKWSYVNTSPPFQWSISTNHIVKNAPDGGNSGFCDGHVKWTPFNKMEKRYGYSVRDSLGDPVPAGATGAMPIFYW
jgi:prepilin-type processing-associated H-X9-DG protein